MTNIDKAEALAALRKHAKGKTVLGGQVYQSLTLETALGAIAALPARGVGVKALQFRDETGDGVLTSRETGELLRIFPQADGTFFAPKLPEDEYSAPDAQTLIDRLNARHAARILSALEPALAPTDAAQAREAALDAIKMGFLSAAPGEWRVSDIERVTEAILRALEQEGR